MIPRCGARVKLVTLRGVAAPRLRAQLGHVGTVVRVASTAEGITLLVSFPTRWDHDTFRLTEGEWEAAS